MRDNVTATECRGCLMRIQTVLKKTDILSTSYNISTHQ